MRSRVIPPVALAMALLAPVTALEARAPARDADGLTPGGECSAFKERVAGFIVDAALCGACHERAYLEHESSGHAIAASGSAFVAEWALVRSEDPAAWSDCLVCHSPTVLDASRSASLAPGIVEELELPGVTCEACHASVGFLGDEPGGGNLIACPGEPRSVGRGHSAIEAFQRGSELCAACHQWENRFGVAVLDTYREWRESSEAAQGHQCQDCHATLAGFRLDDRPSLAAGAMTQASSVDEETEHGGSSSHEYPGSRRPTQLRAAVEIEIVPLRLGSEGRLRFDVVVRNVGAGHAVPTGWTALRLLWLEVEADGRTLAAGPADPALPWDVAGATPGDIAFAPATVAPGSRLYRSIYEDLDGRPTTRAWAAADLAFDNRLRPDEERRESYETDSAGRRAREVRARLYYQSRPDAWSRERGLPLGRPVLVAEDSLAIASAPD